MAADRAAITTGESTPRPRLVACGGHDHASAHGRRRRFAVPVPDESELPERLQLPERLRPVRQGARPAGLRTQRLPRLRLPARAAERLVRSPTAWRWPRTCCRTRSTRPWRAPELCGAGRPRRARRRRRSPRRRRCGGRGRWRPPCLPQKMNGGAMSSAGSVTAALPQIAAPWAAVARAGARPDGAEQPAHDAPAGAVAPVREVVEARPGEVVLELGDAQRLGRRARGRRARRAVAQARLEGARHRHRGGAEEAGDEPVADRAWRAWSAPS